MKETQPGESHRAIEAGEEIVPTCGCSQLPARAVQVRRVEADASARRIAGRGQHRRQLLEARAERRAGAVLEQESDAGGAGEDLSHRTRYARIRLGQGGAERAPDVRHHRLSARRPDDAHGIDHRAHRARAHALVG
ncbi:MAG TPA: hypothetical protein VKF80_09755 [Candidatus Eisenbacteria bacterium]|nr:hypothetical protein [Candidatus Eisenbacteria bacterium]